MSDYPKLEKLTIKTFDKEDRAGTAKSTFTAMFNPETYSFSYQNDFQSSQGVGTDRSTSTYARTKPETLSVTLILDNTGVADAGMGGVGGTAMNAKEYDVYLNVQQFLKDACFMDGDIHEPRFLKLEWGDLIFDCRLTSVTVNYKLFNRAGQPIRCELACTFEGSLVESKRVPKKSPDLSRKRVVKSDDNITILANRMYDNPAYYVRVAEANGLNNFRRLKVGQDMSFPPLAKE